MWPDASGNRRSAARSRCTTDERATTRRKERTMADEPLPVTGAWRPGDDVGHRAVLHVRHRPPRSPSTAARRCATSPSPTRRGARSTHDASNAVLLCHAWTGDSHAAGPAGRGHPTPGWWDDVVGPGKPIDTNRWFVVCANVLGGCQGSTGPASPHPDDGRPYGSRFPVITIRDMVRAQARLADHLGIDALARRDRRLDGRDAGARVGDHVPRAGARRSCRSRPACRRRRSRSRGVRSAGGRSASTRAGAAATTTTPRPATARPRAWRSPAWSPR